MTPPCRDDSQAPDGLSIRTEIFDRDAQGHNTSKAYDCPEQSVAIQAHRAGIHDGQWVESSKTRDCHNHGFSRRLHTRSICCRAHSTEISTH
jgi:hypothetical protein